MFENLTKIDSPDDVAMHQNSDAPKVKALRNAAVLIPLVWHDNQWKILFIRRATNDKDRHSGQVAFPGGRIEQSDSNPIEAALRETHEEIGISSEQINVIGTIDPYITVSSYEVTPVVGIVNWPATLKLQTSEVARAFLIPLSWLSQRENFTFRARQNMDPQKARRHPIVVYEPFNGETLWGATARMTLNFIKAVNEGKFPLNATITSASATSKVTP